MDIEQLEGKVISYKSLLIEWCQKTKKPFDFEVYEDTGNDEVKHFAVKLRIEENVVAKARATSKRKQKKKLRKGPIMHFKIKLEINSKTSHTKTFSQLFPK